MNTDCLNNIYAFMQTSQAVKVTKESAVKRFPKKIVLDDYTQIDQFNSWVGKFDTSRLEEVVIKTTDSFSKRNTLIGMVPPSVKFLTVKDINFSRLAVPPTVEVLVLANFQERHIDLPNGIKKLVLGKGFRGTIRTFPANLEELEIHCWDYPWGFDAHMPNRLHNIPDTVRRIVIGEYAPVVITRWPAMLEHITAPLVHRGVMEWLPHLRNHAPVPENVEVAIVDSPPFIPFATIDNPPPFVPFTQDSEEEADDDSLDPLDQHEVDREFDDYNDYDSMWD
jgi:hypothetical protein